MAENKRYYFLKLKEDFFKDETVLLLEDCKDGFLYSNILLKMYLLSLKHEGQLLLSEDIFYTPAMIATLTHHQSGTVEKALQIFIQLGLVEELTDGSLFMSNIQSMIGTTSSEAERKKKERSKLKRQKLILNGTDNEGGQMSAVCPKMSENRPPEYRDKNLENREGDTLHSLGRYQNVILSDTEFAALKTELPTKWQHYIDRLSEYMASTGKQYKSHLATIRRWAAADGKQSGMPDYSYKEGESL